MKTPTGMEQLDYILFTPTLYKTIVVLGLFDFGHVIFLNTSGQLLLRDAKTFMYPLKDSATQVATQLIVLFLIMYIACLIVASERGKAYN